MPRNSFKEELSELTEEHIPFISSEVWHRYQDLIHKTPLAFSRSFYEPGHITVSAVVLKGTQVALIDHPKLNMWLQPGGHVEPEDDSLLAACLREVREELGISQLAPHPLCIKEKRIVPFYADIHSIPETLKEPSHLHFDIRYCFITNQDLKTTEEALSKKWVSLQEAHHHVSDASLLHSLKLVGENLEQEGRYTH